MLIRAWEWARPLVLWREIKSSITRHTVSSSLKTKLSNMRRCSEIIEWTLCYICSCGVFTRNCGKRDSTANNLSELRNDYVFFAHLNRFEGRGSVVNGASGKILPRIIWLQWSALKNNGESDESSLITSLSSCIISQSTGAVNIISRITLVELIHKSKHSFTARWHDGASRAGASGTDGEASRCLCYLRCSCTCTITICPEPLAFNVPQEDKNMLTSKRFLMEKAYFKLQPVTSVYGLFVTFKVLSHSNQR